MQAFVATRLTSAAMPTALVHRSAPRPATLRAAGSALLLAAVLGLTGCASPDTATGTDSHTTALNTSAWAQASRLPAPSADARWRHQGIGNRPVSLYQPAHHQGRPALRGRSESGDSLVRLPLTVEGPALGLLRFSWFVDALNPLSDLADRHLDDAVARVIVQFDGDRSTFSPRDLMLSDMLQMATGEPLPYATLMYVWDHRYPVGTVIPHARSARIKTLVIESGPERLGRWVDFERDVAADYQSVFGTAPLQVQGIALMTDSNNTRHASTAWYGPLNWNVAQP
jgi:hypothetical protein